MHAFKNVILSLAIGAVQAPSGFAFEECNKIILLGGTQNLKSSVLSGLVPSPSSPSQPIGEFYVEVQHRTIYPDVVPPTATDWQPLAPGTRDLHGLNTTIAFAIANSTIVPASLKGEIVVDWSHDDVGIRFVAENWTGWARGWEMEEPYQSRMFGAFSIHEASSFFFTSLSRMSFTPIGYIGADFILLGSCQKGERWGDRFDNTLQEEIRVLIHGKINKL